MSGLRREEVFQFEDDRIYNDSSHTILKWLVFVDKVIDVNTFFHFIFFFGVSFYSKCEKTQNSGVANGDGIFFFKQFSCYLNGELFSDDDTREQYDINLLTKRKMFVLSLTWYD